MTATRPGTLRLACLLSIGDRYAAQTLRLACLLSIDHRYAAGLARASFELQNCTPGTLPRQTSLRINHGVVATALAVSPR